MQRRVDEGMFRFRYFFQDDSRPCEQIFNKARDDVQILFNRRTEGINKAGDRVRLHAQTPMRDRTGVQLSVDFMNNNTLEPLHLSDAITVTNPNGAVARRRRLAHLLQRFTVDQPGQIPV